MSEFIFNETQQRMYNYINHLCSSCTLLTLSGHKVDNMPVLITVQQLSKKLSLSEKTIQRNLKALIDNNYIYRAEISNSVYIYNTMPITTNQDFICRVKMI